MADANWVREYQDGEIVPGTPYRVIRLLGAGGMGSVYEVEHVELGRRYVLKSLLRTLACRQDLIARQGKLQVGEAVRIAQATLLGLAAAHAIGVIHRDIKPANIFLTQDGGVKVLDFGIAQTRMAGAPKITAQGLAIGTPRYMSPEQASGEKADARSDVYATGLLLFEMIAGHGPFDDLGDSTQQMLAHLHCPARPLSELIPLPAGLEALVGRALAKAPRDRPRSAQYMAAELAPYADLGVPPPPRAFGAGRSTMATSPTPPAVVLGVRVPAAIPLSPEWEDPTKEPPSVDPPTLERQRSFRASSAVGPAPIAARRSSPSRRVANAAPLGAAVAVGLVIGVAVLAFGASRRPSLHRAAATDAFGVPAAAPTAPSSATLTPTEPTTAPSHSELASGNVDPSRPPKPTMQKARRRSAAVADEPAAPRPHPTTG